MPEGHTTTDMTAMTVTTAVPATATASTANPLDGINVAELADSTGLSRHHLHKVLKGQSTPGAEVLVKIAAALAITVDELLSRLPEPRPRRRPQRAHPRQSTHNGPVGEAVRKAIRARYEEIVTKTGQTPTVRELAGEFNVSAQTVSASLAEGI